MPLPDRLEDLPNIGPALERDLRAVGIADPAAFIAVGADEAIHRLHEARLNDRASAQRSIVGAISGERGSAISRERVRAS